jgi:hypothetical protein
MLAATRGSNPGSLGSDGFARAFRPDPERAGCGGLHGHCEHWDLSRLPALEKAPGDEMSMRLKSRGNGTGFAQAFLDHARGERCGKQA